MSDTTTNLFERASRAKIRFETPKGFVAADDLWDLPLIARATAASLDEIAKSLRRQLKDSEEESFVVKASKRNDAIQLAFDVVKHVIDVRLAENEAAAARLANRQQKDKLLALVAEKQDEQLKGSSVEELQAMIQAL